MRIELEMTFEANSDLRVKFIVTNLAIVCVPLYAHKQVLMPSLTNHRETYINVFIFMNTIFYMPVNNS